MAMRPPGRGRRRAIFLAVAITLTVVVVDAVGRSGEEGPDERLAYLDDARPLVAESADQAADLASLRQEALTLDRVAFDRRLERLRSEARSTLEAVQDLDPPDSLQEADSLLVASLAIRSRVAHDLGPAFDLALGGGTLADAVTRFGALAADLTVSDRNYALFAEMAQEAEEDANPPESGWIGDPASWQPEVLEAQLAALRQAGNLAAVHDVGVVTVSLAPPPVRSEGEVGVLATSDPLRVTVIVTNRGSEAEQGVVVSAGLEGGEVVSKQVDLEPGQDLTVTLDGVQPPPPATTPMALVVRAGPVGGEASVDDNEVRLLLRVRDPAEATTTTAPPVSAIPPSPGQEPAG